MFDFKKLIISCAGIFVASISLASCNSTNNTKSGVNKNLLRVLNWEDYIYESEGEDPEDKDLMDQFVDYMYETEGIEIDYVYDTFDTNETMFNELKTGKSDYDIIVPSDYMIQKMIALDMLEPLSDDIMPNVDDYLSPYLKEKFENIHITSNDGSYLTNSDGTLKNVFQYSRPYMWGTVGLCYNPEFIAFKDMDIEQVHSDFTDYDVLYNPAYKNAISIKDSVRDVYGVSVVNVYRDEISANMQKLENGEIDEAKYNELLTEIFNRADNETIKKVQDDLFKMKDNSFGFEVDSGKTDILTGKIGANIAWSGDAVWTMFDAESEDLDEEDRNYLYFSIPKIGSNIWFDGLCMPKSSSLNKELAEKFIDFLYDPANAMQNMDYIGYTPGVAGQEVLDLVYDLYDVRTYDEESETYVDPEGKSLVEGEDYELYDLSYFFGETVEPGAAILHADPSYIGRQLTAQFPSADLLPFLAAMSDFGSQNAAILDMWEVVKTNTLPLWAKIVFTVEVGAIAVGGVFIIIKKATKKKLRKKRREERLS